MYLIYYPKTNDYLGAYNTITYAHSDKIYDNPWFTNCFRAIKFNTKEEAWDINCKMSYWSNHRNIAKVVHFSEIAKHPDWDNSNVFSLNNIPIEGRCVRLVPYAAHNKKMKTTLDFVRKMIIMDTYGNLSEAGYWRWEYDPEEQKYYDTLRRIQE